MTANLRISANRPTGDTADVVTGSIRIGRSNMTVKSQQQLSRKGHIRADEVNSFVYVPFDVPLGVTSIHATYEYSDKEAGNAIDIGIFGQDISLFSSQFRGWSGGARDRFTVAVDEATPGYVAGPIHPGTWNIVLGPYTSIQKGIDWTIDLTLGYELRKALFVPNFAPSRILDDKNAVGPRWYRGDLHAHTIYSDGKRTPSELIEAAKSRSLDFIFSTDHNTPSSNNIWGKYAPKNFLVGRGEEVTTRNGHWNAIGLGFGQWIDFRYSNDEASLAEAVRIVHEVDGFATINHPCDMGIACDWSFPFLDCFDGIEVWNGPWKIHERDQRNELAVELWDKFLRQGKVFTALGCSDVHRHEQPVGLPQTVVASEALSSASIIRGLRAKRAYIVGEPAYSMKFGLKHGHQAANIGDQLSKSSEPLVAEISLIGFQNATMILISQHGVFKRETIGAHEVKEVVVEDSDLQWVRLEVRNERGWMLGMTNPIWLKH